MPFLPINKGYVVIIPLPLLRFVSLHQLPMRAIILPKKPYFITLFVPCFVSTCAVVDYIQLSQYAYFGSELVYELVYTMECRNVMNKAFSGILDHKKRGTFYSSPSQWSEIDRQ